MQETFIDPTVGKFCKCVERMAAAPIPNKPFHTWSLDEGHIASDTNKIRREEPIMFYASWCRKQLELQ